jgi:ribonuclease P protein component
VLPAAARLRRTAEFTDAIRHGRRVPGSLLVGHWRQAAAAGDSASVGFIVSRAVGPAVVRNTVRRRLRHLMRARLVALPAGGRLVIRATPRAAGVGSAELARQLDQLLANLDRGRPQ